MIEVPVLKYLKFGWRKNHEFHTSTIAQNKLMSKLMIQTVNMYGLSYSDKILEEVENVN